MGYKTKVKTLTPKRSTITSNEEKEMIKSTEIHDSSNTYSSMLKILFFAKNSFFVKNLFFCEKLYVNVKNVFFTISGNKTREKFKILLKGYSIS